MGFSNGCLTKKDGSVRICIDPHHLNKALFRPHHPLKTIEQVTTDIPRARMFSTLDATNKFWTISLDKQSSYLTTFATPFRRHRFLHMPFGITSGSKVFQQAMEPVFAGSPCKIIVDDILIWGRDEAEHERNLAAVLRRAEKVNLKLIPRICRFKVPEVHYVGHVLSESGLKPDPSKINTIINMPEPQDKPTLQKFLWTVNYLTKFTPNQSELTAPLCELLHKDTAWQWMPHHQSAIDE